jgi:hypothetical protein
MDYGSNIHRQTAGWLEVALNHPADNLTDEKGNYMFN